MAENSSIAWTDNTLNFWHGCFKVSPGCTNCYAETLSKRYGRDIWGPAKTTSRMKTKGPWNDCIRWDMKAQAEGVRRRVFVMSMGDFFEDHPQVTQWRWDALGIMENFQALDVQLLTKRPENISRMVPGSWLKNWPEHIWIGTSVENQEMADKRIPELLKIPAGIKFLSVEPMLGVIDLHECLLPIETVSWGSGEDDWGYDVGQPEVDWVIVGGESGSKHRPFEWDWARNIREQCKDASVPFFMKQGGGWPNKRESLDDIPQDLRIREYPDQKG